MKWIGGAGILFLIVIVFFWPLVTGERVLYCCDNLTITIPTRLYLLDELRAGRWPLDNPYLFSGSKFFADLNLTSLAPTNLLYFILSPFRALTVSQLVWFVVFGLGMLRLCKSLGLSVGEALIAAVAASFSGVIITYLDNAPHLQAAGMAPWAVSSWVMISHKRKKWKVAWLIILTGLQVVVGHPQITFYTGLIGIIYYLCFTDDDLIGKIRTIGVIGGGVLILTAVQVVPFIKLAMESTRVVRGWEYATFGSFTPWSMWRLFIPSITGNRADGTAWMQEGTVFGYINIVVLWLAAGGWPRGRVEKFWQITAVISLLLASGKYSPVYWLAYRLIPGIGMFRVPAQFLFIYTIAVGVLAGRVIDRIRLGRWGKSRKIMLIIFVFGYALVTVLALFVERNPALITSFGLMNNRLREKLVFLGVGGIVDIAGKVMISSSLAMLSFAGIWWLRNKRNAVVVLIIVILIVDGWRHLRPNVLTVEKSAPERWEKEAGKMVSKLPKLEEGERVYVTPSAYQAERVKRFGLSNIDEEAEWAYKILRPNINMNYKLAIPDGYAAMINKDYAERIGDKGDDPTGVKFDSENRKRLFEQGVKVIIAAESDSLIGGMREIWKTGEKRGIGIYVK